MLMEILKLLIPIVILLVLILLKTELSIAIFSGGLILALIFGISVPEILKLTLQAAIAPETLQLLIIIFMVLLLGQILKAKESLKIFVEATERMLKRKSLIISFSPALIGLLPMPGGALVSAPILNETLQKDDEVVFYGEYVWNSKGGLVHWTHHDSSHGHLNGWLKHNGQKYD